MLDSPRASSGREILLGASNLILGLPDVLGLVSGRKPPPGAVFAAVGHGRSYGLTTRVLVRELPSIRACGIWEAVARDIEGRGGPTRALVTDVGNDLGYGVDAGAVLGWVGEVLDRLGALGAERTLVGLPEEALEARTDLELAIARRIFFPRSQLTVAGIRRGVERLAEGLRALGGRPGIRFVEPRIEWYGLDPIHFRRSRRREVLSALFDLPRGGKGRRPGPIDRLRILLWAPERRRILGRRTGARQPAGRFGDASVWLY